MIFETSIKFADSRLDSFINSSLSEYAAKRNYDHGPDHRQNISGLSPYIRSKILTEQQVIESVLENFSLSQSEKFIQEILWRNYWKGWLEHYPSVWRRYLDDLLALQKIYSETETLRHKLETALSGQTGIECFDFWGKELTKFNYLHNHARMWFASIWIFTLKLPWQLGANFFYEQLLDGDPASNTLSWRWVAGLHTKGKFYLADESNIKKYCPQRFESNFNLSKSAQLPIDKNIYEFETFTITPNQMPDSKYALLLHEDNLQIPQLSEKPECVFILGNNCYSSQIAQAENVNLFKQSLFGDMSKKISSELNIECKLVNSSSELLAELDKLSINKLVTNFAPVGYCQEFLSGFETEKIEIFYFMHEWEKQLIPLAKRGFFDFYKKAKKFIHSSISA